ncbi:MAG: hypothetical protein ACXVAY_00070 [Mucilaginibacter sp.]
MKMLKKISFLALLFIAMLNSCKKDLTVQPVSSIATKSITTEEGKVLTPAGWMPMSNVHLVEKGSHLNVTSGRVLKVKDNLGTIIEDYGLIKKPSYSPNFNPVLNQQSSRLIKQRSVINPTAPGYYNWQAYSQWQNTNTSSPINYFGTSWVVPPAPDNTTDGQTIFIFNGLEGSSLLDIVQPVLQWGRSGAGGGNYYAIANWYVWSDGTNFYAAYSYPISVSSGTSLYGVITNTGQESDGSFDYVSSFSSYANSLTVTEGSEPNGPKSGVFIPYINQEVWAFEALEVYNSSGVNGGYGPVQAMDYPNIAYVAMTNIELLTNSTAASMTWSPETGSNANFGEHTVIASSNSAGSGEVDLYLAPMRPTFTITRGSSYGSYALTITPNIPTPYYVGFVYYTDVSTGIQQSQTGSPTSPVIYLTVGHTYNIYVTVLGGGTPSSGTSATQSFYAYY